MALTSRCARRNVPPTMAVKITPTQKRFLDALHAGATLRYRGWQEIAVEFGPRDPRNYIARQQTVYALRDRGLVVVDAQGVRLSEVER